MKDLLVKLSVKWDLLKDAVKDEEGQDLIEYALIVALIAFAATAGMGATAAAVNSTFTHVSSTLATYTG